MTKRAPDADIPTRASLRKKSSGSIVKLDPTMHDALDLVLKQGTSTKQGVLHWSDAMTLGGVCRESRKLYEEHREIILSPLLKHLEGMIGSNIHSYCGGVYVPKSVHVCSKRVCSCASDMDPEDDEHPRNQDLAALDPRYDEAYETWSALTKCRSMVGLLETVVGNMRKKFCFEDPANPRKSEAVPSNFFFGVGFEHATEFLHSLPHRATLALNIGLLDMAQGAIERGDDHYFNDVFLGKKNAYLGGGSGFGIGMCNQLGGMIPLENQDFIEVLRIQVYPSKKVLALLGPALVQKVVLSAPFFRWVPPANDEGNMDMLMSLPTPLEHIDDKLIREYGLEGEFQYDA